MFNGAERIHSTSRLWLTLAACSLLTDSAMATLAGQIEARLVITSGCQVNQGGSPDGASVSTAHLDFGSLGPVWSAPLSTRLKSSDGDLAVACGSSSSNPTQFTVIIDGGTQGDGSTRYLSNGSQRIPYELSVDQAGNDHYSIGQQRTFTANTEAWMPIPIYGALASNTRAMPAGVYRDTVTVTLNW
jgi:spore coat protein U-like protein